ncbi:MAG: mandelate racemase/muconate lactonizing protein [Chloroflexi bacterium]|nr:MAG: mandelate racemase/muconate lactonizing protein [Chloroflexota bacterium]
MRIGDVRLRHVSGRMRFEGDFWEERLIRPVDVYPKYRAQGPEVLPKTDDGAYRIETFFVEIESDEGVVGIGGPIPREQAFLIDADLKPHLIGADPLAHEVVWDTLYRVSVHGRKGLTMMAISAVDCALWDLKGRYFNTPVYRLLGGPTRSEIPAYASALGYSVEPDRAAERAREFVRQGYTATKWFFRNGPADGPQGMVRNSQLVSALRGAIGDEVDLMLDCWMSWDVPYTVAMAERLEDYEPRWLEEPVLPDKIESYAAIRRQVRVPISGGEHEYTRWGLKALMDAEAVDVLQPDIYWAGGITEMLKICALASTYDLPVIPHGHSTPASAHLIASQPTSVCPLLEYLIKWNEIHQFFLKTPLKPERGVVHIPETPGLGMDLDEAKIESQRIVRWTD